MTGYCKWCDTLIDEEDIVQVFAINPYRVVWSGCGGCHTKRNELMNNDKKQVRVLPGS